MLRVKAGESVSSVTALFPFGLVQKLRYFSGEDVWQARILCALFCEIVRGHAYRESKSFVIASKPPVIQINPARDSGALLSQHYSSESDDNRLPLRSGKIDKAALYVGSRQLYAQPVAYVHSLRLHQQSLNVGL